MTIPAKAYDPLYTAGFYEGISYLLLLFIAMPLKYFAGMPIAVRIIGTLHGALFTWFIIVILLLMSRGAMSVRKAFIAFFLSLVPFGTFYLRRYVVPVQ